MPGPSHFKADFRGAIGSMEVSKGCVPCGRGFHRECLGGKKGCSKCHGRVEKEENLHEHIEESSKLESNTAPKSRKSSQENLRDKESTGRKRAAKLYPLNRNDACEWRNQRNCGGGRRPVIGCLDGNQQHRHHGPVKNTIRNELGNVHRICDDCHVHWHELNDLVYNEEDYNLLPHLPVPAADTEIVQNIIDWKSGVIGKKYELASTKNREKYDAAQALLHSSDSA